MDSIKHLDMSLEALRKYIPGGSTTSRGGKWEEALAGSIPFQYPPSTSSLLLCVAIGLLSVVTWRRYFSPISDIPGPFFASFTRFWHVKHIIIGDQNLELSRQHARHGHFVRMAPNEVSVSHPDGIKKLLLQPLPKGSFYNISSYPDYRYQTPMSERDPKRKVERSKNFSASYALSTVSAYEPAINGVIEKLLSWLDHYSSSSSPSSHSSMPLDEFFTYTAFDVVGEVMFSRQFGFLDSGSDVGSAISNNLALEAVGTWVAQFRPLQLSLSNPIVTFLGLSPGSMLFRTTEKALAEREANPDARFDMVAHWFRTLRGPRGKEGKFSLRDVQAQATTNVGAGSDTVSCGLQSIIYHMVRNPETWARARDEVDEKTRKSGSSSSNSSSNSSSRVVSLAEAQGLTYLQACMKEALRIHSPVPMGLPRVAPKEGVEVGGRLFPEGTTVTVSPWVMHHSEEIWGKDVEEFKPERWLGEDAVKLEKYFIPFGAGFMSCPGQHIAKMEMLKICATIIRDYDLELVDPKKQWKWKAYFTMVPHSWPVKVSRRR